MFPYPRQSQRCKRLLKPSAIFSAPIQATSRCGPTCHWCPRLLSHHHLKFFYPQLYQCSTQNKWYHVGALLPTSCFPTVLKKYTRYYGTPTSCSAFTFVVSFYLYNNSVTSMLIQFPLHNWGNKVTEMLKNFPNFTGLETGCDFVHLDMETIIAQPFAVQNIMKTPSCAFNSSNMKGDTSR